MSPAVCRCFSDSRVLDRYAIAAAGSSPCSAGGDGAAVGTAASARGGPPVGTATSASGGAPPGCNQLALGGASPGSGAVGTGAGAGADMRPRPAAPQTATTTSSPTRFHLAARRVSRRSRPHAPFEYLGSYIPALDPPAVARINHSAGGAGCRAPLALWPGLHAAAAAARCSAGCTTVCCSVAKRLQPAPQLQHRYNSNVEFEGGKTH